MTPNNLPVPFPCLRASFNNQGLGRNKFSGKYNVCPASRKDLEETSTQSVRGALKPKTKIATRRPSLAKGLRLPAPILMRGSPERRTPRLYSN
jgi:hypothetical protein